MYIVLLFSGHTTAVAVGSEDVVVDKVVLLNVVELGAPVDELSVPLVDELSVLVDELSV